MPSFEIGSPLLRPPAELLDGHLRGEQMKSGLFGGKNAQVYSGELPPGRTGGGLKAS